jgi:hypothetical protein
MLKFGQGFSMLIAVAAPVSNIPQEPTIITHYGPINYCYGGAVLGAGRLFGDDANNIIVYLFD